MPPLTSKLKALKISASLTGTDRIRAILAQLGRIPQSAINKGVRAGAKIVLATAKSYAPYDTGALESGLSLKAEKSRVGKKFYQITFPASMNSIFVKDYAGGKKRAYYPASQEWGWKIHGIKHYPPRAYYMRHAADDTSDAAKDEIIRVMNDVITKIWKSP